MEKHKLRSPFFVVNPKSYLYGEELRKLATKADELCEKYDFDCLFTAQLIDLAWVAEHCTHLIPCARGGGSEGYIFESCREPHDRP